MNGVSQERLVVERKIRALEDETAERLETIRVLDEQWDDYRRVMRDNAAVFEQAAVAMGADNYFVKKGMAARREMDAYVAQLTRQFAEEAAEMAQEVRSASDAAMEQLQQERTRASWV
jgi:hypothetical protein